MPYNHSVGAQGEGDASDFLRGLGANILQMNYRCPYGEIDIIAVLDGVLIFCEVKRRSSKRFGTPAEAITPAKQRKIIRTAEMWLTHHPMEMPMRFDVIEITPGRINHIPAAFDASR